MGTFTYNGKTEKIIPAHEFYPTPYDFCYQMAVYLCNNYQSRFNHILDPCMGDGIYGKVLRRVFPDAGISGIDIRHVPNVTAYDVVTVHYDFLWSIGSGDYDLIMSNPPFSLAEQFITHSLDAVKDGGLVVFLLRDDFMHSQGRYERLYKGNAIGLREIVFLASRPSFTGDGKTDSHSYSYLVFKKGYIGKPTCGWLNPSNKDPLGNQLKLFKEEQS